MLSPDHHKDQYVCTQLNSASWADSTSPWPIGLKVGGSSPVCDLGVTAREF